MKKLYLCLLILLTSSYLYADEGEALKQEYRKLSNMLEKAEENYWKKKYRLIELKQDAKNELEELGNEYDDFMKLRNGIKEEILSLEIEEKGLTEKIDNYKMRVAGIYSSYIKIIDKLTGFMNKNFPFTSERDLLRLNDIRGMIEKKEGFIKISNSINGFINSKINDSRICDIKHSDILTNNKIPKKGKKLRLGYIFYGYITDDDKDAGIVLRTGRVAQKAFKWHEEVSSYKDNIKEVIDNISEKIKFAFLPMDVMQSNAVGKSYARKGPFLKGFVEWFKSGGIVMYAIVIVLGYALFIIIERIIIFRRNQTDTDSLMEPIIEAIEKKDFNSALDLCKDKKGPLSRMLEEVFEKKRISREEAYNKMQEVLLHEIPVIEKHLSTLKSLAALAPLLGLLGTVTGMISLFDVITSYGTGDPRLLAGGIAEALVTTEFGLIVAIPAILSHRILLNIAERIISDIERHSITLLNIGWKSK